MSLRSMTGYGRGQAAADGYRVDVELRSVNRKQFDASLSIAHDLLAFEPLLMDGLHKSISRGRISGEVSLTSHGRRRQGNPRVDEDLAAAYVRRIRKTARRLGLKEDLDASLLVELPGVVTCDRPEADHDVLAGLLARALDRAVGALVRMRTREGAALQRDLEKRLALLERLARSIRRKAPAVPVNYREALLQRLEQAGVSLDDPDGRLVREIALFADRTDVSEEITRLDSHFKQARELMRGREPAGRALDFLAQEMFREINTTGSKANDAAIVRDVVFFKTELERFREQVQNVE